MRFILAFCLLLNLTLAAVALGQVAAATQPTQFSAADITIDSGDQALAAWQVELVATQGEVKIVGVEGGTHKDVYRDPPYYDPAALAGGRIIIASYTTNENPPKGKVLVARVHLQSRGEFTLTTKVIAAADPGAGKIDVTASVSKSNSQSSSVKE